MGELGTVRRYSYWSDRRVTDIAADNGIDIDLGRRWRLGLTLGLAPRAEIAEERRTVQRHEVAVRAERAIGKLAVEDFVTPSPAKFAKGCGEVTFAAYTRWYGAKKRAKRKGVIVHTRTVSTNDCRVEIILFASIENCAGYLSSIEAEAPGWSASSTGAIEEFISHRGTREAAIYDDDESIAVEILRVINNEGMTGKFVFKRIPSAEWFAEVYHDVELDKDRWLFRPGDTDVPEPVDRIVIGAPLWIRSDGG